MRRDILSGASAGLAYVGTFTGYHTIDVSIPTAPRLIGSPSTIQAAVHDLAHNGNRTLVAITSFAGTPSLAVGLYDTTNPADATRFLTSFATPGDCRAVALHQGLTYVADSAAGLQVLNYLGSDTQGAAPIVTITRTPTDVDPVAPGTQVFGGIRLAPGFQVTDDAQVRTVELLLDGLPVDSDSAYPFELSTPAPNPTATKTTATLQVRATDTGGNVGLSALLTLELRPGPPSPFVVSSSPEANGTVYDVVRLQLIFDVPLDPALLSLSGFSLSYLGADNVPGGGDDRTVDIQGLTAALGNRLLSLTVTKVLPLGSYELIVSPEVIADLTGSHAAEPFRARFALALNPNTVLWISDSDGNWSDPTRWSTGRVPGTNDPVLIDRAGANPVITIDQDLSLPSLRSREALVASNRKLTLYGSHASEWAGAVTLSNCTVTLTGLGAVLSAPGVTQSVDTSFLAQSGARLSLPQLARFTGPAISDKTVRATGAGSRVDLAALTEFTGLGGPFRSSLEANNGGTIAVAKLAVLNNVDLLLHSAGGVPTAQLTRYTAGQVTATSVHPDFGALIDVSNAGFVAESGSRITLPGFASIAISGDTTWEARGAGSRLDFSNLTSVTGPTSGRLEVQTFEGGVIDLTGLNGVTKGRWTFASDGVGSLTDLRNVSILACTSGSICEADHDGLVRLHPGAVTTSGIEFQLRATGAIELGALELGATGRLTGAGTLTANVSNGGEVIPGASAGAITINGDYTQTAAGKLRIELGGLTAGTQFDQLNVTGLATLNGNFTISRISGFTQATGQSFRVLTFGSRAGDFATTTGLAQGAVTLQLNYTATSLDLVAP